MEWVFRKLSPEALTPEPGEIYLWLVAAEHRQRRDLTRLVLEFGPKILLQGPGTPVRLVVNADPTLDEMLAASCVLRQLEGRPLAPGCQAFAHYAALVREGLRPAQFPLEQSLEGIYLAVRGKADQDLAVLGDQETAQIFAGAWSRMANVIFQAADEGKDPFTTPLFAAGAEFARERAFLAKDLDVYRLDFSLGEAWEVRLPGGPARARGLLLRRPKSLLFKYWVRTECPAPLGGPYHFLAVDWGNAQWVFSTDPVQKLSIKSLADLLDDAEKKQTPPADEPNGWFDGKPFQHTLVAAPRPGTRLSEKTVLRLVKKWCKARPLTPVGKLPRVLALLSGSVALAALLLWYFQFSEPTLLDVQGLHVLCIGVSKYQNIPGLSAPAADADAIAEAFKKRKGGLFKEISTRVLKNEDATRARILDGGLALWLLKEQALTRRSLVIVTMSGHGFIDRATNRYHFAPHDYDPDQPGSTGLYLADLQRYFAALPCTVLVVFDTCHSGAANESNADESKEDAKKFLVDMKRYLSDSTDAFSRGRKGLAIIAACAPEQLANETKRWKHGALTLALLEGIEGKYLYQGSYQPVLPRGNAAGIVTLHDLDEYMKERVEGLSAEISNPQNRGQAVNTLAAGNVTPRQIPITSLEPQP